MDEVIELKSKDEKVQRLIEKDPWEEIGFQRPLGSFWYSLSISIFGAIVSISLIPLIYKFLYPYPEMQGYNSIATAFFAIIYQVFDIGTAFGIERFIGEYRIKNPKKMLEYVRFFIWYQMMTGLIQVFAVSVWVFQYFRFTTERSYLTWLFLIICQRQYPGMLNTFGAALKGLQKFNKSQILSFLGGQVFQNLTNIIFILLGRWWGTNNPAYGDLMGGAIGFALGVYIDDFFTMMVAGKFLNTELKILGYRLKDVITPHISGDVAKECLWFGLQASAVPLLNIVFETIILFMFLDELPQYTTWILLKSFAGGLTGIVNVGNFETISSIAESYSNGKKELAKFYVSYSLKWNTFLKWFLIMVMLGVMPLIFEVINTMEGLELYRPALYFIPFLLIEQLFFAFIQISDPILLGTLHVPFYAFVRLVEEIIRLIILFILLKVYGLGDRGIMGVALTLVWDRFYARLIKMVLALIYINKKVFKVEIYWMSTIILPLIASIPVLGISLLFTTMSVTYIIPVIGLIPTVAIGIIMCVVLLPFLIFLPLVGFLGAFDDMQLVTFKKSVELSGPSKKIVNLFYKAVVWGHEKCRWKNKYKIPWDVPLKQMEELMEIKASYDIF